MNKLNIENKVFGRLRVLNYSFTKNKQRYWVCQCSCGKTKECKGSLLTGNRVRSCGCLQEETRTSNGKKSKAGNTLPSGEASFNRLFKQYRSGAKKRNIDFGLSKDDFKALTKLNCHYCSTAPKGIVKAVKENGSYTYSGIDRLNPTLGYYRENCVACCGKCNMAKHVLSESDFLDLVRKIYENRFSLTAKASN